MDLDHVIGLIDGKAARAVDAAHASGAGCGVRSGFHDHLAAAVRLHRNRVVQHMHVDLARVAARGRWNHDALRATGGGKTEKARKLCRMRREKKLAFPIEIDGGIHPENLAEAVRAGCEWIVTGSAIFHSSNAEATTREMREIAAQATAVRC